MQARTCGLLGGLLGILLPAAAIAQSLELIGVHGDWRTFRDVNAGPSCFIYSEPMSWNSTRDGQAVSVERGDIRLFINIFADAPGVTEPSFRAGYTLTTDSPASVVISGAGIPLYPNAAYCAEAGAIERCDQYAWTEPNDDAALVAAMKAGSEAVVTARSQRGTVTTDTFSLTGFTAALDDAIQACSQ